MWGGSKIGGAGEVAEAEPGAAVAEVCGFERSGGVGTVVRGGVLAGD